MKAFLSLAISTLLCYGLSAQDVVRPRGRNENVTEYSNQQGISKMHRVGSQKTAPLKSLGSPNIPVVLVQFSDLEFRSDVLVDGVEHSDANVNALYDKVFNGNGKDMELYTKAGSMGSVRDYFRAQSSGIFDPNFNIIGPVTLPEGYAYYGKNNGGVKDVNIGAFYSTACKLAVNNYDIDWKVFDNDANGIVDMVFFIYAGEGENGSDDINTIWPKESGSSTKITYDEDKVVTFGSYACTNELYLDRIDGIGNICHELSHGLGLPDLYDYSYTLFGLDYWDLMDAGAYCNIGRVPSGYSAYERDFMGWRPLQDIALGEETTITLDPMTNGGYGYKLTDPEDPNHYYILENRQNISMTYDRYLGLVNNAKAYLGYSALGMTHGLMVTQVKYNATAWKNNTVNTGHEYVTIIPADGKKLICDYSEEYFTSMLGDLYPGIKEVNELELLGQKIEVTENSDNTITLKINGEATGISSTSHDGAAIREIYSLGGQRLNSLQPGINIIKYSDGSVKKVNRNLQ